MIKGIWNARKSVQKGFTLVELLVVIAIIGILATLVLLQLGTARSRARDTRKITTLAQLQTAVESWAEDHSGKYPAVTDIEKTPGGVVEGYLSGSDPLASLGDDTQWGYLLVGNNYQLWVELENKAAALDNDADLSGGTYQDGTAEACVDDAALDCVYDLGS